MKKNPDRDLARERKRTISKRNSLALILGGVFLAVFFIIWGLVAYSHLIVSLDSNLEIFINSHQAPIATPLMVLASLYGREYFWVPVVAVMLVFGKKEVKLLAIELIILFIVGLISGEALKIVFFRARPFVTLGSQISIPPGIPPDADSSFPSGHAIIVSIGASFLLWKFMNRAHASKARIVALLLALEAAIVCYSRLYNGVHYPLDVVAGIILASAITFLVSFVIERWFALQLLRLAKIVERLTKEIFRIPEIL